MAEEGAVIGIHTVDQWKEQLKVAEDSKKLVVVDFTATWCGPCRMIAPLFAELAKRFVDVIFLKVDVDELQTVAKEWKINAMPTFVFLKEGVVLDKLVGAHKDDLPKKIELLAQQQ